MSANSAASASNVTITVNTSTWKASLIYCDSLVHNGASDWRLPTQKELYEAYTHGVRSAVASNWVSLSVFDANCNWSATTVSSSTNFANFVCLYSGRADGLTKNNSNIVTCVR